MNSKEPWGPTAPDDPSAYEYAAWHALVGQVVVGYRHTIDPATKRFGPPEARFFKVAEARISRDLAFLRLVVWAPPSHPRGEDLWVGGVRTGMYSMCLRPDGGFQVAGDKLVPIDDEDVESISAKLDSATFREFRAFLGAPLQAP
ncbi:MAG: hypothetical protein JSR77_14935 [Planctomycetes bacterium]|nr:hypothetical protein [Planctomycetota bacterium]